MNLNYRKRTGVAALVGGLLGFAIGYRPMVDLPPVVEPNPTVVTEVVEVPVEVIVRVPVERHATPHAIQCAAYFDEYEWSAPDGR
jgi:hypothetical protein